MKNEPEHCIGVERASPASDESGAVLVLTLFLLIALLAFGGVAVDSGTLYRAQLQLQEAADAAVLAGLGYAILQTDVPIEGEAARVVIEAKAQEIALLNMERGGVDYIADSLTIVPIYDPVARQLRVQVQADINLYLIDLVPFHIIGLGGAPSFFTLTADAGARRAPANLALVLDYSDSMQCPSGGTCNCLQPNRTMTCEEEAVAQGQRRKIDDLRAAVHDFLGYFDEERDRISLTLFNIAATVEVPITRPPETGFEREQFDVIDEREPASNTNVCDGFMRSFEDMSQAGIAGNEEAVYIYFSDGAPTAGRFLLAAPNTLEQFPTASFGAYDYTHYTVQWVDQDSSYAGPSSLIKSGTIPFSYNNPLPPSTAVVPTCDPFAGVPQSDPQTSVASLASCVTNLGFHLPGASQDVRGEETGFLDWREQYYNCAVEMADFMRSRRGLLYSIGLGPELQIGTDPYQDIDASFARKDVFLSRVANDYLEAGPIATGRLGAAHPQFRYDGYQTYEEWQEKANSRIGRYYATPESEDLDMIFKTIAQRVLLRLLF